MRFGMAEAKQDRRDRGRGGGPPEFPELLQRAEALVPVLRERAGKAEELRRLPEETIEDLHRSGLFRILQPRRVGGSELPFRSIGGLGSVISRGDGSTGWVLANLAAHHWLLGMWPKQAQDEIWGESPDNLIGSALIFPRGRATPAPGGYRLTGRWPFSSGVDAASWSLIGAIVHDQEAGTNEPRIFLLPARTGSAIARGRPAAGKRERPRAWARGPATAATAPMPRPCARRRWTCSSRPPAAARFMHGTRCSARSATSMPRMRITC